MAASELACDYFQKNQQKMWTVVQSNTATMKTCIQNSLLIIFKKALKNEN